MQKVRMRQWLLLLLRVLAIALIVCAFARPTYQSGAAWGGRVVPAAAAVLVDQSYSTSYRLPSGTLADRQRARIRYLTDAFSQSDQVALIPFATIPRTTQDVLPSELDQRVAEWKPSQEATDLESALRQAFVHLAQHPELDGELYLFTDGTRYNWSDVPDVSAWNEEARIYLDLPEDIQYSNAYVGEVRFSHWMVSTKGEVIVYIDVHYDGPVPLPNHTVDLFVDGERVGRRSVDLQPQSETQVELRFTPRRSGRLHGFVELGEDDLSLDNRRYFTFHAPAAINALALGPQPASTYYVRRALSAAALGDPVLSIRSGRIEELSAAALGDVDVLLLCDIERLDREQTSAVHDFVSNGGGLLVFPSVRADLKYLNRDFLPGLVPLTVRGVLGDSADKTQFRRLDSSARMHPLFANLLTDERADAAHFFSHFLLQSESAVEALAYFDDGQIALASSWRGMGRTALAAFPLDMTWSDLPLRGLFAPMIHRLVRELSQPTDGLAGYTVGEGAHRYLGDIALDAPISALTPSGQTLRLQPTRMDERYVWSIPELGEIGIWQLKNGERTIDSFSVNFDPRESDLRRVERAEIERVLGSDVHMLGSDDDVRLQVLGNRHGRELWRECIALALVLLLIELWLGRSPRGVTPTAERA